MSRALSPVWATSVKTPLAGDTAASFASRPFSPRLIVLVRRLSARMIVYRVRRIMTGSFVSSRSRRPAPDFQMLHVARLHIPLPSPDAPPHRVARMPPVLGGVPWVEVIAVVVA